MGTEYYKISDFAKVIGKHVNTVDNWFKALEEKHVHSVSRLSGEKVYDDLDLQIGMFIRDKRDEKWSLEGIFNVLPDHFELRPFSIDESPSVPQVVDMDAIMTQIRAVAEEIAATQVQEVKNQYEQFFKQLPRPADPLEEKQKTINNFITQRRVMAELENEALKLWSTHPPQERLRKMGLFRKEEDYDKRNRFIRDYINERLEERLKSEYGIELTD